MVFSVIRLTKKGNENSFIEKIYNEYSCLKRKSFSRAIIYAYRAYIASKNTNWDSQLILGDRSIITSYTTRWRKWFNSPYISVLFVNITEPFMRAPDVVIFLQVSMENLEQRIRKRNSIDIDSSLERLHEMNNAYREISTSKIIKRLRHVKWVYVDGNQNEDAVYDEICRIISCFSTSVTTPSQSAPDGTFSNS